MNYITPFIATVLFALAANGAEKKPLKVFILAGQSNMEGPANIKTFDYIGDDPATAPMLKMMRGADGKPTVCKGVWISYLTGAETNFELAGQLTAGYGSLWGQDPTKPGPNIGPEFTFGLTMDAALDEPVLIIKTAWGGKSLHTDFRSPSAGPYELPKETKEAWAQNPKGAHGIPAAGERAKLNAEKVAATGVYYRLMMEHVKKVLSDLKRVYPEYQGQGYELAGFVWLQGWNDLCDGATYPRSGQPDQYALYSELLAHFIRDVRKDLTAPKMPFVIGVAGFGGLKGPPSETQPFRQAMAAPAAMPEFKGKVVAVETAPFWAEELGAIDVKRAESKPLSPAEDALWERGASNAGYHYLGCAKTFALMGKAFAEALLPPQKTK